MKEWLEGHDVQYETSALKVDLFYILVEIDHIIKYRTNEVSQMHGHKVA